MKVLIKRLSVLTLVVSSGAWVVSCNQEGGGVREPAALTRESELPSEVVPSVAQYPIRQGDRLIIRLTGVPQSDQGIFEVRVNETGHISMPHIGAIKVEGLTLGALKELIESEYKSRNIYKDPVVQILNDAEPQYIDVGGDVRSPQRVAWSKDMTLLSAIAACGDFNEYADRRRVSVMRGGREIGPFDVNAIRKGAAPNPELRPGDTVFVGRTWW